MHAFPEEIAFHGVWRPYQQRILDELAGRMAEEQFHLVAAPGAGKTVLGLELMRRLGHPALILCPTVAIRNQWRAAFLRHFSAGDGAAAISLDLTSPALLTISTYQSLYAASCRPAHDCPADELPAGDEDDEIPDLNAGIAAVVAAFQQAGIGTLVVDEAHHLHAAWWKVLDAVRARLGKIAVVALTATPPYDLPESEWSRYQALCGPVDLEVSLPEMVREGNLCPHQDYLYLNAPTEQETHELATFREGVARITDWVASDNTFADVVAAHPWLTTPDAHIEAMLDDPDYLAALLIFHNHTRLTAPPKLIKLLGVPRDTLPPLGLEHLEVLLTHMLFTDNSHFRDCALVKSIADEVHHIGAIERKQVRLRITTRMERLLASSANKVDSVPAIARAEASARGTGLRLLVLTDLILKEALRSSPYTPPVKRLGAAPLFDLLRRAIAEDALLGTLGSGTLAQARLALLTGTLAVIPLTALEPLRESLEQAGIDSGSLTAEPLAADPEYLQVALPGSMLVEALTALFARGEITILVGTRALLGEGWDAPCVNALILATTTRSFVTSNQLRGRALRTDPAQPDKVASIWHLICCDETGETSPDWSALKRRFTTFPGLHRTETRIETGLERLQVAPPFTPATIARVNAGMLAAAGVHDELRVRWATVLVSAPNGRMRERFAPRERGLPMTLLRRAASSAMVRQGAFLMALLASLTLAIQTQATPWMVAGVLLFAGNLVSLKDSLVAYRRVRSGPAGSLCIVGQVVLDALAGIGALTTPLPALHVTVETRSDNRLACRLNGGTTREANLFLTALAELTDPIDNPRYLLIRRRDTFPVPKLFAAKKDHAERFADSWRRHLGAISLVYTRTSAGRATLLAVRARSIFLFDGDEGVHESVWGV